MTPRDVLKLAEQRKVQFVDLRFMDFPGLWQHTTCPASELTLDSFDHGFGFDGSSIRGWQAINESDMRSEEHTSELQSRQYLVCRLLLETKKERVTLSSSRL